MVDSLRLRIALTGAFVLLGLMISAPAQAAVIFGSDLTLPPRTPQQQVTCDPQNPTEPCTDIALTFHTNNAHPTTAPVSGVITSVRYRSSTPDQATLRLARLDQNGDAVGAGTGPTATLAATTNVEEVPAQLRVQVGDYLGGQGTQTTAFNCSSGGSFDLYLPVLGTGPPPRSPTQTNPTCELLIQATIEPDNDNDGLGDETQDADDDNDNVPDATDNCGLIVNPSQANADGDALGDACDPTPSPPIAAPLPKRLADLPPPIAGRLANVEPVNGTVTVAFPAGTAARTAARASQKGLTFVPLREARQIPVGSFLNTRRGTVRLRTATGSSNATQTGNFARGLFQVLQSRRRSARGLTDLVLKGGSFTRSRCGSPTRARATGLRRRTVRRLRSNARGRFRTRGRQSAATVRGTVWDTTDRCDGTLTKVTRGSVVVRDFRRRRNVIVRAGRSYLAKAVR